MLVVSQFTLYADCRKGRLPNFTDAARREIASPLCDSFVEKLRAMGPKVETGEFQAEMLVSVSIDTVGKLQIELPRQFGA